MFLPFLGQYLPPVSQYLRVGPRVVRVDGHAVKPTTLCEISHPPYVPCVSGEDGRLDVCELAFPPHIP